MFDTFRRALGIVHIQETDTEIIISGIDGVTLERDISKYWKTSRITANMFNKMTRSSVSFYKFFAPEVMYMLENVVHYRSRWLSVKTIVAIKEALMEFTWLRNTRPVDQTTIKGRLNFKALDRLHFKAKDYQMEYFKDYNYRLDQYGLLGDLSAAAPGAGKTYLGVAIAEMVESDYIIALCEKRALDMVWIPSIHEMHKTPQTLWNSVTSKVYRGERYLVCHYEGMATLLDIIRTGVFKGKRVTVLLDESHNMNDPQALRSQQFMAICESTGSQNRVLLSGTPVKALGVELITLLRVVDPMFTPVVEERFRKIYGREASKGLDIIRHRLGLVSYKIEKQELNLKAPIMRPYPIKIPNGDDFTLPAIRKDMESFIRERALYYKQRRAKDEKFWQECIGHHQKTLRTKDQDTAFKEYLRLVNVVARSGDPRFVGEEIKETNRYEKMVFGPSLPPKWLHAFRDVKSVIKYTHLKIQGECLGRILGGKRIAAHVAMIPYIDWVGIAESTQKKTIAFTSFVEAVEASENHCRRVGLKPIVVYGKTTGELASIVKRFDEDSKANPLVATYASLATAVRLTMADTMILLNSPFRSYILEQAVSRIHRLGQDSQTIIYQASLDTGDIPNISTRSADILEWSQQQVAAIMGVSSPFELGEALEHFEPTEDYDENKLIHGILQSTFEQFDIGIDRGEFIVPVTQVNAPPVWAR